MIYHDLPINSMVIFPSVFWKNVYQAGEQMGWVSRPVKSLDGELAAFSQPGG